MAELTREQIKQAMRHPYSEWTPQFVEQLCDMAMRACDAPEGAKDAERLPNMELADGFGDPETLLNSRDWLTKAVKAKGAEVTGGGCGFGQADIDIKLEGDDFNVSIKPIIRNRG